MAREIGPGLRVFEFKAEFRPGQREEVETLLSERRLLLVAPTGGGKSLIYQLPAVLLAGTVPATFGQPFLDAAAAELEQRCRLGHLRSLPDRYSALLREGELKGYTEILEGTSGDVGLRLLEGPLGLVVEEVAAGSPAALRGIRPGDRILAIEEAPALGWSALRGEQALRGEPGSVIRIRLRHPGEPEPVTAAVRRARAQRPAPATRVLGPGIGYVRLANLTRGTADRVTAAVNRMVAQGARAVVLDLVLS